MDHHQCNQISKNWADIWLEFERIWPCIRCLCHVDHRIPAQLSILLFLDRPTSYQWAGGHSVRCIAERYRKCLASNQLWIEQRSSLCKCWRCVSELRSLGFESVSCMAGHQTFWCSQARQSLKSFCLRDWVRLGMYDQRTFQPQHWCREMETLTRPKKTLRQPCWQAVRVFVNWRVWKSGQTINTARSLSN